jgi:hypothetical protein
MFLEMHLGPMLVEKKFIDFTGCETIAERENLLNNQVEKMFSRNIMKVAQSREEPVFYLDHVPSSMAPHETIESQVDNRGT